MPSYDVVWPEPDPKLIRKVARQFDIALDTYRTDPQLVREHANQEDSFRTGGYSRRQLLELVQNAADAIQRGGEVGRVELRLRGDTLYCANEGAPFDEAGVDAVTHAFISEKRGDEIGRFGLGFKSILGLTSNAQIFSRSVSFEFNSPDAQRALSTITDAAHVPLLRIPTVADTAQWFDGDPDLQEMATWATTIIRLPSVRDPDVLKEQISNFGTEFLLFANSVRSLRLVVIDSGDSDIDELHECRSLGDCEFELTRPGGEPERWYVAEGVHRPSPAARKEVGEAVARDEFRISLASPLDPGTRTTGQFWAYFPLNDKTTALGLFNAPWHVNDDRTSLQRGAYNDGILDDFVDLFVTSLDRFRTPEDPARHFDYMPSRLRETEGFADAYLTTHIPLRAGQHGIIPDVNGTFRRGSELRPLEPEVDLGQWTVMRLWQDAPQTASDVPNASCYGSPARRTRLRDVLTGEYMTLSLNSKAARSAVLTRSLVEWLTELGNSTEPKYTWLCLQIVRSLPNPDQRRAAMVARVLPLSDGSKAALDARGSVFLKGESALGLGGFAVVSPTVLAYEDIDGLLREFGFQDLAPDVELAAMLRSASDTWSDDEWDHLWLLTDEVATSTAQNLLRQHVRGGGVAKVKTRSGLWMDAHRVFDPDRLGFDLGEPDIELDSRTVTSALAAAAGVTASVDEEFPVVEDPVYSTYRSWAELEYRRRAIDLGFRTISDARTANEYGPGPLRLLEYLRDANNSIGLLKWSAALLSAAGDREWGFRASGQFPEIKVIAPHLWAVTQYGLVATSWGPRQVEEALHPALNRFASFLPIAGGDGVNRLDLPAELASIPTDIWRAFLGRDVPGGYTGEQSGALLVELVLAGVMAVAPDQPTIVPAILGRDVVSTAIESVFVAATENELAYLSREGLPFLKADALIADALVAIGCMRASDQILVSPQIDGAGEPVLLVDMFPLIRDFIPRSLRKTTVVRAMQIARRVTTPLGMQDEAVAFLRADDVLYVPETIDDGRLLHLLSRELNLGLDGQQVEEILRQKRSAAIEELEEQCRSAQSDAQRIGLLLSDEALDQLLPTNLKAALSSLGVEIQAPQLPQLLLDVHGYDTLRQARVELDARGLGVPERWAGSVPALRFVKNLGFPDEYAGERGTRIDSRFTVAGKPILDDLHDYQEELCLDIAGLLDESDGRFGKAMIELPTGAGKTRVTVEALIRLFLDSRLRGPVLWVAQSEELCEQAVQTWSEVWRKFADSRPLEIGRLWSSNEVPRPESELSVVVATDAKLDSIIKSRDSYAWLARATYVVIDEAHTAGDAPMYTRILAWLGIDGRSFDRPLLGLSATPFKGSSSQRTERLASRFGGNLINRLGSDPYGLLQSRRILARVQHEYLEGADLNLTADERAEADTFGRLSSTVLERVATDQQRTARLVEDILGRPAESKVLVFTSSVLSAQIVAALLKTRGVAAAAVSGETRRHERRRVISRFAHGDLQVLTNCDVLTQGFDAPAVDVLYIARPTLSPNAYIQMVGRGLRGPLNGGTESCTIVDLQDTFSNLGRDLAYREFEEIWSRESVR